MSRDASRRSSPSSLVRSLSPHDDDIAASSKHPPDSGREAASNPLAQVSPGASANHVLQISHNEHAQSTSATEVAPLGNNAAPNGTGSAIPYETRSRNRTGASRPNYAEDKEMDGDFEITPPTHVRRLGRGNEFSSINDGEALTASQNPLSSDPDQSMPLSGHAKESTPGTSSFSANSNLTATGLVKKRKAAAQVAVAQQQLHSSVPHTSASQPATRRSSTSVTMGTVLRESNMLSFDHCAGRLRENKLIADDGTMLEVNDHVYLICEPPGEPYYLGRIMEFLHTSNDSSQPIDALRLNWYYRPKDIGRKVNDTRQVFASMHSDISPLTSLRGKCQIKHKSEIDKLDDLKKSQDCFWYEKLYDRYIHRFYDVVPTSLVINVPMDVKKVLDERWKYIIVEPSRGKELTSAVKSCKRCSKYCASNDSVDCAVCQNTYHMSCVSPPLLKKPSRGFAWACGPCSKAQEKKLEARNTPNVTDPVTANEEEEMNDEDGCGSPGATGNATDTGRTTPSISIQVPLSVNPGTVEQLHQASLWLYRYLGIHCKVEDVLDYDDRIYPRASSRLGPKHQANVPVWPGRPIEYAKPADIRRKYIKGGGAKKDLKLSKETIAALEADKTARENRPKWVVDKPIGYVHRGEDLEVMDPNCTSQLLYKLPETPASLQNSNRAASLNIVEDTTHEQAVFDYMGRAAALARLLGLPPLSTNLLDVALEILHSHNYDTETALNALSRVDRKIFKEPDLSTAEVKKFEDGVSKYGSELHSIKKHVKSVSAADIVRYYYTWKKTERGKQIWGNYSGRKGKKEAKKAEATVGKLQDDVADEHDDSAFDNDKAAEKKRGFECKFCFTRSSRQWRRAPNTLAGTMVPDNLGNKSSGKDKGPQLMVALCRRCAELWRRYAIQWEDVDEVVKKVAQAGGRTWKRRIDEEVIKELVAANEVMNLVETAAPSTTLFTNGSHGSQMANVAPNSEPPRKKTKTLSERAPTDNLTEAGTNLSASQKKKLTAEKAVIEPPRPPEPPKPRALPCAICGQLEPLSDQLLACKDCRLSVHRNCYGVDENRNASKWACDMCSNDKNPQVSIQYRCMLCPVEYTEHDFVEPLRVSSKKKTEKDRERDRAEREIAQSTADYYRKKQEEHNKPLNPREPLKRTANNNWVHVTCAVFTPEVKFGNAKALEPSEGIPTIPPARHEESCKVCKKANKGACVGCHSCRLAVHVECAHQAGYILGFDITPVKGSRRDQFNIVTLGDESGIMTATIWCKEHAPTKTIVHQMHEIVDKSGLNALQLYVQNFKQADLTLTGTVRKATLVTQSTKSLNLISAAPNSIRRTSTTANTITIASRGSVLHTKTEDLAGSVGLDSPQEFSKSCVTCHVEYSPRWWAFPRDRLIQSSAPFVASIELSNRMPEQASYGLATTGAHEAGEENGETHAALAAAALHQNNGSTISVTTNYQCHQCHWKKIQKESTPPTVALPSDSELKCAEVGHPSPVSPASGPDKEITQPSQIPYAWPNTSSFAQNGMQGVSPYRWPNQSPPIPQTPIHMNGHHSPQLHAGATLAVYPQSHMRQPSQVQHQNGHNPHGPPTVNGFTASSHHSLGSSYNSYTASRTQSIANGGPPPRALERSFLQATSSLSHQPFNSLRGSPPTPRDVHTHSRESSNGQISDNRSVEARVNGGASASPSLRNLLS